MSVWTGELDVAPTWALFVGTGGSTRRHSHLAHKLVVALDGDTTVDDAAPLSSDTWVVHAGQEHAVHARGRLGLVFFDAGTIARLDLQQVGDGLRAAVATLRSAEVEVRAEAIATLAASLPRVRDARVSRASALLRGEPRLDMTDLASRVRLSSTRLSHLFAEDVGAPPRSYRSWGTLRRAIELMAQGQSLTDAAHEAGFTDSAHLSRAFTAMLGVTPSSLAMTAAMRLRER